MRFFTKRTSLSLALPLTFALVFVACAPAAAPTPTPAPAATKAPAAAPAPTQAAAPAAAAPAPTKAADPAASKTELPPLKVDKSQWPKAVSIGTASMGGTNYIAGGALAKVFEKIGVQAAPEVTGGSVQNPQLIQSKQIQFANIAQGSAFDAWNGTGWAKSKHTDLRSMFAVLPQWMHGWALAKSGIKSYKDLNGKTASGGPAGGTSDLYLKQFTELLGIKLGKVAAASYADTTGLLKDGLVDAVSTSSGVPHPSAAEMASTHDTIVFGFAPDEVKKIAEKYPAQAPGQIAANTYKGQTQPIDSVADWVAFFCHKDMPEDFVYEFTKAVFANKDMLVSVHKAMSDTTEANVKAVTLPMHPGAYRYFVEKGIPMSPLAKPVQ